MKRIYDVLVEDGTVAIEQLERVHAPIGLDIGAVTPQEIAVAIVAELIAVRRGKADAVAGASLRWMPKLRTAAGCLRAPVTCQFLIRNAHHLTMNDALDVLSRRRLRARRRIAAVGEVGDVRADRVINAAGGYLLPGFIQTHVHLCQTLFRGYADDLALLDWLKRRIWPMEAAHTPASLAAAARLAAAELLLGGTTTVLTMETVHDTDAVFEALEPMGLRAVVGKCMMDADQRGAGAPARTDRALDRREPRAGGALARSRQRPAARRVRAAICGVLFARAARSRRRRCPASATLLVHTHASENRDEIALVRSRTGRANVAYLDEVGLASPRLCLAHCVWVDEAEQQLLASSDVKVLHCPGSNLKLASGIAPVVEMRAARHLGVAGRRRRGLQQPARHVRGDAAGGRPAGHHAAAPVR